MSPSAVMELTHHSQPRPKSQKDGLLARGHGLVADGADIVMEDSPLLARDLHKQYPSIVRGKGNYLYTQDGRTILDSTGGAAVSCLGHGNERLKTAVIKQMDTGISYVISTFWRNPTVDELCQDLRDGTNQNMSHVYLTGSGSEAIEAAIKLARQFFLEHEGRDTPRVNFIAREGSYHGNTIGALSMSGHVSRRAPYEPFLMANIHRVSSCYAYRQRRNGESDASFVARKAAELDAKFHELGPETVIGFIAEPVVGAALGCVPYVPGYLKAMREVCHSHGALFILDEVMSGIGRCGTLHAWQAEDTPPDLEAVGKGLGAGIIPIAAVLISEKVVRALERGTGQFVHGQTYQGMPIQAAAALEVQRILREDNVMDNVTIQGAYLEQRLKSLLGDHPNVGDIRGKGLFWGLEFVKDKHTKEPFEPRLHIAERIHEMAISEPYNMSLYPGTGTADGIAGDHIIISPSFLITQEEIEYIAQTTASVVQKVFEDFSI